MTAHHERIFSRPDRLNDFQARIMPVGVNSNQTPPRPQRPGQRRNNPFGTEIHRRFRPIGLGGDHKIEIGLGPPRPGDDRIKQEPVVVETFNRANVSLVYGKKSCRMESVAR